MVPERTAVYQQTIINPTEKIYIVDSSPDLLSRLPVGSNALPDFFCLALDVQSVCHFFKCRVTKVSTVTQERQNHNNKHLRKATPAWLLTDETSEPE